MRANRATDAAPPAAPALALVDHAPSTALAAAPAGQMVPMAGPLASALQALQAGVPLEQLQGLLAIQKDWEANEARKAFVADMAAFKLNPPEILKDKHVTFETSKGTTSYDHATIGNVCEKIIVAAAAHGFSHRWVPGRLEDGRLSVTTVVTHRLGHFEETVLEGPRDDSGGKNAIQGAISTNTYLSRHGVLMAFGFATKDQPDDDGRGAAGGSAPAYDAAENLEHWLKQARAAETEEAIAEVRAAACNDFEAARDLAGWETVRDEIKAIRTAWRAAKAGQQ